MTKIGLACFKLGFGTESRRV